METRTMMLALPPTTTWQDGGAGRLGQAMARTVLRAGRRVVIANSRGPESLSSVASALGEGVSAGTVA
jgi:predicted dinucleotide-binding enzyme